MVDRARLESVCRGNSTVGSNPTLSASLRYRLSRDQPAQGQVAVHERAEIRQSCIPPARSSTGHPDRRDRWRAPRPGDQERPAGRRRRFAGTRAACASGPTVLHWPEPSRRIRPPAFGAHVIDRDDVRMVQARGRARLVFEAAEPIRITGRSGRQDLDGELTTEAGIARSPKLASRAKAARRRQGATGFRTGRGACPESGPSVA